jgi:hypothetical protein
MQKGKILSHYLKYGFAQDIGYVKSPHIGNAKVWQDWSSTSSSDQPVLYLFLSLGTPYYQEGCNISSKTKDQKCSLVYLSEI